MAGPLTSLQVRMQRILTTHRSILNYLEDEYYVINSNYFDFCSYYRGNDPRVGTLSRLFLEGSSEILKYLAFCKRRPLRAAKKIFDGARVYEDEIDLGPYRLLEVELASYEVLNRKELFMKTLYGIMKDEMAQVVNAKNMLKYEFNYLPIRYHLFRDRDKIATVFTVLIDEIQELVEKHLPAPGEELKVKRDYGEHKLILDDINKDIATFILFERGKLTTEIVLHNWKRESLLRRALNLPIPKDYKDKPKIHQKRKRQRRFPDPLARQFKKKGVPIRRPTKRVRRGVSVKPTEGVILEELEEEPPLEEPPSPKIQPKADRPKQKRKVVKVKTPASKPPVAVSADYKLPPFQRRAKRIIELCETIFGHLERETRLMETNYNEIVALHAGNDPRLGELYEIHLKGLSEKMDFIALCRQRPLRASRLILKGKAKGDQKDVKHYIKFESELKDYQYSKDLSMLFLNTLHGIMSDEIINTKNHSNMLKFEFDYLFIRYHLFGYKDQLATVFAVLVSEIVNLKAPEYDLTGWLKPSYAEHKCHLDDIDKNISTFILLEKGTITLVRAIRNWQRNALLLSALKMEKVPELPVEEQSVEEEPEAVPQHANAEQLARDNLACMFVVNALPDRMVECLANMEKELLSNPVLGEHRKSLPVLKTQRVSVPRTRSKSQPLPRIAPPGIQSEVIAPQVEPVVADADRTPPLHQRPVQPEIATGRRHARKIKDMQRLGYGKLTPLQRQMERILYLYENIFADIENDTKLMTGHYLDICSVLKGNDPRFGELYEIQLKGLAEKMDFLAFCNQRPLRAAIKIYEGRMKGDRKDNALYAKFESELENYEYSRDLIRAFLTILQEIMRDEIIRVKNHEGMLKLEFDYLLVRYLLFGKRDKLATVFAVLVDEIESLKAQEYDLTASSKELKLKAGYVQHTRILDDMNKNISTFLLFEKGALPLEWVIRNWKRNALLVSALNIPIRKGRKEGRPSIRDQWRRDVRRKPTRFSKKTRPFRVSVAPREDDIADEQKGATPPKRQPPKSDRRKTQTPSRDKEKPPPDVGAIPKLKLPRKKSKPVAQVIADLKLTPLQRRMKPIVELYEKICGHVYREFGVLEKNYNEIESVYVHVGYDPLFGELLELYIAGRLEQMKFRAFCKKRPIRLAKQIFKGRAKQENVDVRTFRKLESELKDYQYSTGRSKLFMDKLQELMRNEISGVRKKINMLKFEFDYLIIRYHLFGHMDALATVFVVFLEEIQQLKDPEYDLTAPSKELKFKMGYAPHRSLLDDICKNMSTFLLLEKGTLTLDSAIRNWKRNPLLLSALRIDKVPELPVLLPALPEVVEEEREVEEPEAMPPHLIEEYLKRQHLIFLFFANAVEDRMLACLSNLEAEILSRPVVKERPKSLPILRKSLTPKKQPIVELQPPVVEVEAPVVVVEPPVVDIEPPLVKPKRKGKDLKLPRTGVEIYRKLTPVQRRMYSLITLYKYILADLESESNLMEERYLEISVSYFGNDPRYGELYELHLEGVSQKMDFLAFCNNRPLLEAEQILDGRLKGNPSDVLRFRKFESELNNYEYRIDLSGLFMEKLLEIMMDEIMRVKSHKDMLKIEFDYLLIRYHLFRHVDRLATVFAVLVYEIEILKEPEYSVTPPDEELELKPGYVEHRANLDGTSRNISTFILLEKGTITLNNAIQNWFMNPRLLSALKIVYRPDDRREDIAPPQEGQVAEAAPQVQQPVVQPRIDRPVTPREPIVARTVLPSISEAAKHRLPNGPPDLMNADFGNLPQSQRRMKRIVYLYECILEHLDSEYKVMTRNYLDVCAVSRGKDPRFGDLCELQLIGASEKLEFIALGEERPLRAALEMLEGREKVVGIDVRPFRAFEFELKNYKYSNLSLLFMESLRGIMTDEIAQLKNHLDMLKREFDYLLIRYHIFRHRDYLATVFAVLVNEIANLKEPEYDWNAPNNELRFQRDYVQHTRLLGDMNKNISNFILMEKGTLSLELVLRNWKRRTVLFSALKIPVTAPRIDRRVGGHKARRLKERDHRFIASRDPKVDDIPEQRFEEEWEETKRIVLIEHVIKEKLARENLIYMFIANSIANTFFACMVNIESEILSLPIERSKSVPLPKSSRLPELIHVDRALSLQLPRKRRLSDLRKVPPKIRPLPKTRIRFAEPELQPGDEEAPAIAPDVAPQLKFPQQKIPRRPGPESYRKLTPVQRIMDRIINVYKKIRAVLESESDLMEERHLEISLSYFGNDPRYGELYELHLESVSQKMNFFAFCKKRPLREAGKILEGRSIGDPSDVLRFKKFETELNSYQYRTDLSGMFMEKLLEIMIDEVTKVKNHKLMLKYEFDYLLIRYHLFGHIDQLATVFAVLVHEIETLKEPEYSLTPPSKELELKPGYMEHRHNLDGICHNLATFILFEKGTITLANVIQNWLMDARLLTALKMEVRPDVSREIQEGQGDEGGAIDALAAQYHEYLRIGQNAPQIQNVAPEIEPEPEQEPQEPAAPPLLEQPVEPEIQDPSSRARIKGAADYIDRMRKAREKAKTRTRSLLSSAPPETRSVRKHPRRAPRHTPAAKVHVTTDHKLTPLQRRMKRILILYENILDNLEMQSDFMEINYGAIRTFDNGNDPRFRELYQLHVQGVSAKLEFYAFRDQLPLRTMYMIYQGLLLGDPADTQFFLKLESVLTNYDYSKDLSIEFLNILHGMMRDELVKIINHMNMLKFEFDYLLIRYYAFRQKDKLATVFVVLAHEIQNLVVEDEIKLERNYFKHRILVSDIKKNISTFLLLEKGALTLEQAIQKWQRKAPLLSALQITKKATLPVIQEEEEYDDPADLELTYAGRTSQGKVKGPYFHINQVREAIQRATAQTPPPFDQPAGEYDESSPELGSTMKLIASLACKCKIM